MITLWLSLSSHAPCVLVLQCKLELDELFLVPSMIKLALWDQSGIYCAIHGASLEQKSEQVVVL
jgi:hypothetical protein